MVAADIETQIAELASRYGQPERVVAMLHGALFSPVNELDRYGEVCMVIRRPNGRLLTAIKTFYPRGAYRLLTGGIKHGELVIDALGREVAEETSLDTEIRRFLAVIEYRYEPEQAVFYSFVFLLDEVGGTLAVQDPDERLEAFREITIDELPTLAATLDSIAAGYDAEIDGKWSEWGQFRAVAHRVVYQALHKEA